MQTGRTNSLTNKSCDIWKDDFSQTICPSRRTSRQQYDINSHQTDKCWTICLSRVLSRRFVRPLVWKTATSASGRSQRGLHKKARNSASVVATRDFTTRNQPIIRGDSRRGLPETREADCKKSKLTTTCYNRRAEVQKICVHNNLWLRKMLQHSTKE